MSLRKIFNSNGGFLLVKKWLYAGVLPYAIAQFLLTGYSKKMLELLRSGVQFKINKALERKYAWVLKSFEEEYQQNPPKTSRSNYVWFLWMQGIDNAPEIIKKCYCSVCQHMVGRNIILLTEKNIQDYVSIPIYIWEKYEKGLITRTHLSDLIRIALLAEYGGIWIDSTVYCSPSMQIPTFMTDSKLFIFQNLKPGADASVLNCSSWYIAAESHNHIILAIRELLWKYWEKENKLIDYFLLHHFMMIVCKYYPVEWKEIPQYSNSMPHVLLLNMFESHKQETLDLILSNCPFHKLTYKFSEQNISKPGTIYRYFMDE